MYCTKCDAYVDPSVVSYHNYICWDADNDFEESSAEQTTEPVNHYVTISKHHFEPKEIKLNNHPAKTSVTFERIFYQSRTKDLRLIETKEIFLLEIILLEKVSQFLTVVLDSEKIDTHWKITFRSLKDSRNKILKAIKEETCSLCFSSVENHKRIFVYMTVYGQTCTNVHYLCEGCMLASNATNYKANTCHLCCNQSGCYTPMILSETYFNQNPE